MIGLMPRYVPRARKRLTFSYTRPRRQRRRKEEGHVRARVNSPEQNLTMAFDHGPTEFPVATIRPRDSGSLLQATLGDLGRWVIARWTWFKPRSIPCVVACLGMIAVMAAGDYLAHHLDQNPPQHHKIMQVDVAHR